MLLAEHSANIDTSLFFAFPESLFMIIFKKKMNKSLILTQITAEELQCEFKQIMQSIISLEQKIKIPNPARELMTIDEVAKYFKKHKDTIENWTRKGFLVKYGIENSIYYQRSEVENALTPLKR